MSRVFANGRSILHKGDGHTHTSAAPDVCKVPTPGGPVPTPFVNSAQDSMLGKGSRSVTIEGNPVALTSSELSTSSGDEPGTAGGLISSRLKGKMAWGSGSVDVKVEGKGVVRFLDPTLHNGNTFNTAFISAGGTGLAYGDDTECTACGKPVDDHRVLETPEVVALVEAVFMELMKRLHEQRPLIERCLQVREARKQANEKLRQDAEAGYEAAGLEGMEAEKRQLQAQLRGSAANKRELQTALTLVQQRVSAAEGDIKARTALQQALVDSLTREMNAINARIEGMGPVLRRDKNLNTFAEGYMVGICVCKCPQLPRRLAACSGSIAPGFREAVVAASFELVEGFQVSERQQEMLKDQGREKWECAAPKLLQAGGAGGHKVRNMSERFFSPMLNVTVEIEYSRVVDKEARTEKRRFGHAESVPSCETCQKLTPEMLCENHKECA